MRRLAILTALAMATTASVALAEAPIRANVDVKVRVDNGARYQNGGFVSRHVPWDRDTRKVVLARHFSASTDRQFINLQGRGGSFHRLTIEGTRGAPLIERVYVEYLDRTNQTVDLNTRLPRGQDQTIRLNGNRGIQRIVVYTNARARGAYSVYGT